MKILILTNMYPTPSNPAYGAFIAAQVASLRKYEIYDHIYFINGMEKKRAYFRAIWDVTKLLKEETFELVHTHHSYCNYILFIAMRIARKSLPVVTTFHESEVWLAKEETFKQSLQYTQQINSKNLYLSIFQYLRKNIFLKMMALRWVDAIIAVDKNMVKNFMSNIKNPLIYEIPCGVDIEVFKPMAREECRSILSLPQNKCIIIFPSNPERPAKGFNLFQDAIQLLDRNIKIMLHVISAGNIPHEKMPFYYNASDVVVHPSLYEASPTAIKEAMACNIPIVASKAGDTQKILGNLPGHFLCDLNPQDIADKIKYSIDFGKRTEARSRIIEEGLDLVSTSKKIKKVYQEVIKNECSRHS
jgi:teichuronic acid biosynthesis glycosyltransferase TuaC